MADIRTNSSSIGQVQIADEVIAVIAGTASMEVEGVDGMAGNFTGDIVEKIGKKSLSRGVKVNVEESSVTVELNLFIKFGFKIQEVAIEVQKRVKTAIETMTGLTVTDINIVVAGVIPDKHPRHN